MSEPNEVVGAVALFLEEQGYQITWHNSWQFSVGGPGQQWVICVVEDWNDTECIEAGPGIDNNHHKTSIQRQQQDPEYYELADPSSFDKLLDFLRVRGCEPCR